MRCVGFKFVLQIVAKLHILGAWLVDDTNADFVKLRHVELIEMLVAQVFAKIA